MIRRKRRRTKFDDAQLSYEDIRRLTGLSKQTIIKYATRGYNKRPLKLPCYRIDNNSLERLIRSLGNLPQPNKTPYILIIYDNFSQYHSLNKSIKSYITSNFPNHKPIPIITSKLTKNHQTLIKLLKNVITLKLYNIKLLTTSQSEPSKLLINTIQSLTKIIAGNNPELIEIDKKLIKPN